MKKQILNLGKTLNTTEQKQINGGFGCQPLIACPPNSEYDTTFCLCVPSQG